MEGKNDWRCCLKWGKSAKVRFVVLFPIFFFSSCLCTLSCVYTFGGPGAFVFLSNLAFYIKLVLVHENKRHIRIINGVPS